MSAHDLTSLPPSVRQASAPGGLERFDISTPLATAEIYDHGAHLARWQPSHAAAPVLWMSGHSYFQRDKPIRGGVPICFPWFGPHPEDATVPAHGFARLSPWTLCEASASGDGTVTLAFELETDNASPVWPHHFHADLRYTIGSTLGMELIVHNVDTVPFTFEEALHTYFTVSDIAGVTISGLEQSAYLDKVGGRTERQAEGRPIQFTGETDRVYLDTTATCSIDDPGLKRRIVVRKDHSRSTIVWNPWIAKARAMPDFGDDEWRGMVCVETANVGSAAVTLHPGEQHRMTVSLAVESH
jgi:glucose-6-phosphate 1-epimerase